ncbi:family 20 glycosylhydrolase [Actinocatenispora comari]|uniref:beta-N-acetylhexosaminidase n=1 Tax=Actinocatenispora comari TaxID=2807577 RepID=A0A8J4A904_9ACTN|nr:family 20 glycosylhydrolase [Actinocatenispora comari]GIL27206.1 hypothetical protein NUM_24600 [Actinocatenispora comari]
MSRWSVLGAVATATALLTPLLPALAAPAAGSPAHPATAGPAGAGSTATRNAAPVTVPALRSWHGGSGQWRWTDRSRIVLAPGTAPRLRDTATTLAAELAEATGHRPDVVGGPARTGDVALDLTGADATVGDQGYRMTVGSALRIAAPSVTGDFYGTRTLLQAMRTSADRRSVPRGTAVDSPNVGTRGEMIDVGRKYYPVDYLKQQIRQLAWYKENTLHLHLSDWRGFRLRLPQYPGLAADEAYSVADIRELTDYARRYHVTIIPEIDLPGHATAISAYRPDLAFSCSSMSRPNRWTGSDTDGWTLDVTNPDTVTFLRGLVRAVGALFPGPYLSIGGDELPGTANQNACPELVDYQHRMGFAYPGDVFVHFIDQLDETVRAMHKSTVVWQWWDYQQTVSIVPNHDVIVDEWLSEPTGRAAAGYRTIGTRESTLYVSPGFGTRPGQYGYVDPRSVYRDYPFTAADDILGYQISRWSDHAESQPVSWFDFWARRPLAVVADRTWAAPTGGDVRAFLDRYDRVGDADVTRTDLAANPGMLSSAGWQASATSAETTAEDGAAANAVDNDPYTIWHSDYSDGAPTLPQRLTIDTGAAQPISGFRYLPRQDGGVNGRVAGYRLLTSTDGTRWTVAASGTLPDTQTETVVRFAPTTARWVALDVESEHGPNDRYASVAELDLVRG